MIKSTLLSAAAITVLSLTSFNLLADWKVDNDQSTVSFISVKKTNVMEAHHFNNLSGKLSKEGAFSLAIDLASVDTTIGIRDQRMKEHLFEQSKFAQAIVSGAIPANMLAKLVVNETTSMSVAGQLDLHGNKQPITLLMSVTKLSDSNLLVASQKPVMIKASDFGLVKGIETLRNLAGLPSISTTVPVSFVLRLNQYN